MSSRSSIDGVMEPARRRCPRCPAVESLLCTSPIPRSAGASSLVSRTSGSKMTHLILEDTCGGGATLEQLRADGLACPSTLPSPRQIKGPGPKEFIAEAITLLAQGKIMVLRVADPDAVHAVRTFVKKELASQLRYDLLAALILHP